MSDIDLKPKQSKWRKFLDSIYFTSGEEDNRRYFPFRKGNKWEIRPSLADMITMKYKKQPSRWRKAWDNCYRYDEKKQALYFPWRKQEKWLKIENLKEYFINNSFQNFCHTNYSIGSNTDCLNNIHSINITNMDNTMNNIGIDNSFINNITSNSFSHYDNITNNSIINNDLLTNPAYSHLSHNIHHNNNNNF